MRGGRFLSCTGGIFPKSAEVGGRHGAVRCKAAAGFVPVHCCRSPHIRLIQSQRHQMPWECQTQSLKRQPAQRKKNTNSNTTTEDLRCGEINFCVENANGVVKMGKTGRVKKKRSPSWVNCMKTTCVDLSVFTISNIRLWQQQISYDRRFRSALLDSGDVSALNSNINTQSFPVLNSV